MSSSWSYLDPVILPLITGETVLDVGCGMGRWGALIETNYWEAKLPAAPAVDGCDAFSANVDHCRRRGAYRRVWEQTLPSKLDGTWDTVLAVELIEHVAAERVDETLELLEAAARRRIIVSTPNSPAFREAHETPLGLNPREAHVSYVPRKRFVERGYTVYGAGFGRYDSRLALWAKGRSIRPALNSLPYRFPRIAETLVAVKETA